MNNNFKNASSETASYSYFSTSDTTPALGGPLYQSDVWRFTTTSLTDSGSYTTSNIPPGQPGYIQPGPSNPGGWAKFNQTHNVNVSVSGTISLVDSSGPNYALNYSGTALFSTTSNRTVTFDASQNLNTQSGSYNTFGNKAEWSSLIGTGSTGTPAYGHSWKFGDFWGIPIAPNYKTFHDSGTYPSGGTSKEDAGGDQGYTETDTWYGSSPNGTWSETSTSSGASGGGTETIAPDGGGPDNTLDSGDAVPGEAMNGAAPWYNDGWGDWLNPFAWLASAYYGTKDALLGGYEFLTKDHAAEWADYYAQRNANALALSMDGDVAAFRKADGQAIEAQANNVVNDALKWGNAYITGIDLIASGVGLLGAAKSFVEGDFLNCTLLQKACFAAGTPIVTPDGSKLIEWLRVGHKVLSRPEDDPSAPLRVGVVTAVFELRAQIWELHIAGKRIDTTAEHPFFVVGEGWTPTNRLKPGDILKGSDEQLTAIDRVVQTDRTMTVYNATVESDHTFFVGSAEWGFAVWAHNRECNTEALERSLVAARRPPPRTGADEIAHIVPWGKTFGRDSQVKRVLQNARGVLRRAHIKLDDVDNLFWATERTHESTHTSQYFRNLANYLKEAEKNGTVRSALQYLGAQLEAGNNFLVK